MSYAALPEPLAGLVEPTRVRNRIYTDPAVFDLEMDRIFGRSWLFVAHDSQIRNAGDYVTARMGRMNMVVVRDAAGRVHVVENRCSHRGNLLCAGTSGTLPSGMFQCAYHDWTFECSGRLRSVPARDGYADLEGRRSGLGLLRAARVDSYRGFIFASLSAEGPSLPDFLGYMKSALDNLVDRAPAGEIEVAGGSYRQSTPSNWKLQVENLNDLSHAGATHRSAVEAPDYVTKPLPAPAFGPHKAPAHRVNGAPLSVMDQLGVRAFPNGHSFIGGLPRPPRAGAIFEEYRRRLERRVGAAEVERILSVDRHIDIIYPNLLTQGLMGQIKILTPIAVDRTETTVFIFRLKGAPEEMFQFQVRAVGNSNSVANFTLPDDLAMYRRCQLAMQACPDAWSDFSRGAGEEAADGHGGLRGRGLSEMSMRNAYRTWLAYMEKP